jgi:gas vesicle protein
VLFAPDKGSETRKKLTAKGQDYLKKGEEYVDDIKRSANDFLDDVTEEFTGAKKELATAVENGKSSVLQQGKNLADNGRARANEFKREAKTPDL